MIQDLCKFFHIRKFWKLTPILYSVLIMTFILSYILLKVICSNNNLKYFYPSIAFLIVLILTLSLTFSIIGFFGYTAWLFVEKSNSYIKYQLRSFFKFKKGKILLFNNKKVSVFDDNEMGMFKIAFDNVCVYKHDYLTKMVDNPEIYKILENIPYGVLVYCYYTPEYSEPSEIMFSIDEPRKINVHSSMEKVTLYIQSNEKSQNIIAKLKLKYA